MPSISRLPGISSSKVAFRIQQPCLPEALFCLIRYPRFETKKPKANAFGFSSFPMSFPGVSPPTGSPSHLPTCRFRQFSGCQVCVDIRCGAEIPVSHPELRLLHAHPRLHQKAGVGVPEPDRRGRSIQSVRLWASPVNSMPLPAGNLGYSSGGFHFGSG